MCIQQLLQPSPNAEGEVSLTDGQMFNLVGNNGELHLHHLILNCMAVNEGGQVGVAGARADAKQNRCRQLFSFWSQLLCFCIRWELEQIFT